MSRKEAYFNTVFKNSICDMQDNQYSAYKISDIGAEGTIAKPFDGFGVYQNQPLYWEGKRTNELKAFNIKHLFEGERGHQMNWMSTFSCIPDSHVWIVLFAAIPRKNRMYVFDYGLIKKLYESGETSIKKKVLEKLPFSPIKKDRFDHIYVIDYTIFAEVLP